MATAITASLLLFVLGVDKFYTYVESRRREGNEIPIWVLSIADIFFVWVGTFYMLRFYFKTIGKI